MKLMEAMKEAEKILHDGEVLYTKMYNHDIARATKTYAEGSEGQRRYMQSAEYNRGRADAYREIIELFGL